MLHRKDEKLKEEKNANHSFLREKRDPLLVVKKLNLKHRRTDDKNNLR